MTALDGPILAAGYRQMTASEEEWVNSHSNEAPRCAWAEGYDPALGGYVAVPVVPVDWSMPEGPAD